MTNDTERILEAVSGVRQNQRNMDDKLHCMDGKLDSLSGVVTGHLGWHNGVEKAETKAAKAGERTTAKAGVAGTWFKTGLVALAMMAAAILFVATGIGASERERPDEVRELSARIDALVDAMEASRSTRGP